MYAGDYLRAGDVSGRFFQAAQALEAMHRRLNPPSKAAEDAVTAKIAEALVNVKLKSADRATLRKQLRNVWLEPSLAGRIRAVYEATREIASRLVADADGFADRCAALRNYVAHVLDASRLPDLPTLEERDLQTHRLRFLLQAYALTQLGYGDRLLVLFDFRPSYLRAVGDANRYVTFVKKT